MTDLQLQMATNRLANLGGTSIEPAIAATPSVDASSATGVCTWSWSWIFIIVAVIALGLTALWWFSPKRAATDKQQH